MKKVEIRIEEIIKKEHIYEILIEDELDLDKNKLSGIGFSDEIIKRALQDNKSNKILNHYIPNLYADSFFKDAHEMSLVKF